MRQKYPMPCDIIGSSDRKDGEHDVDSSLDINGYSNGDSGVTFR